jgi:nucleotide-binding universal stress UspA family protein
MPILVGFVPTPEGRAALRRAVQECHLRHTRLVVVDAERPEDGAAAGGPSESEVRTACAELGVPQPELEIRRFDNPYEPADHMLEVADEVAADLIVLGLRRRTGVGKLILGGSAQRILLDASCPVMAVKTDREARALAAAEDAGDAAGNAAGNAVTDGVTDITGTGTGALAGTASEAIVIP